MPEDLNQTIAENAQGPKRAKGDSGEMDQHSLTEQVEADRYLESKKATRKKGLGFMFKKLSPPGAE